MSPAVTRSMTRAVPVILDTPKTKRHDDTGDSPTMVISTSYLDINHVSLGPIQILDQNMVMLQITTQMMIQMTLILIINLCQNVC